LAELHVDYVGISNRCAPVDWHSLCWI